MAQSQSQGLPETRNACPMPPYNTLNFDARNPSVYSTLQSYAFNSPQFPLPQGSNARQIADNQANVAYFNSLNQQTLATASTNHGLHANVPYPQFRTEGERLKYRQGLATTAMRTYVTGQNPATPAGVPLSTIYQIINDPSVYHYP